MNDRPVVSNLETVAHSYIENDPATPISNTVVISDVDNATLASGTVSVDANYTPGEDVLGFVSNPATMGNIAVVSNSGGVLSLASAGATATVANWQAAFRAVTYQNTSEIPTTAIRRFLFQVNDGSLYSLQQYRYFTVTSINDAPTVTAPASVTTAEDTAVVVGGISFADVDANGASESVSLSVSNGTLSLSTTVSGGLTAAQITGNGTGTVTITAPLAAINATLANASGLTYRSILNYNGSDSLVIGINDLGNTGNGGALTASATVGLTITAVNDPPSIAAPAAVTTAEDIAVVITGISFTDVDAGSGIETVTLSVLHGTIAVNPGVVGGLIASQISGSNTSSVTINAPLAAINATFADLAGLVYLGTTNYNGLDTLSVGINDNGNTGAGGALTASANIALTITPVNDAPTVTAPISVSTLEDTPVYITGVSFADVDVGFGIETVTLSVAHGTLTLNPNIANGITAAQILGNGTATVSFSATLAAMNATFGDPTALKYQSNLNYNGSDTLSILINDNGNVGAGGPQTGTASVAIAITPVSDQPVLLSGAVNPLTVLEDAAATSLGFSSLAFGPGGGADEASQTLSYIATAVPSPTFGNILLADGTTVVTLNSTYTLSQLQGMQFKPALNANGTGAFTFAVKDNGGTAFGGIDTLTETASLTVTPVNDPPTITSGAVNPLTILEDAGITSFGFGTLTFGPGGGPDEASQTLTYTVTAVPAPSLGQVLLADGTTLVTPNATYTLTQIQGMQFKAAPNANGSGTFTFTVQDNGGTANGGFDTLTNNVLVTVTSVNDQPVIKTGAINPLTVLEDAAVTSLGFTNLTFGPGGGPDEASQTLTYKTTVVPAPSFGNVLLSDGTTVVTANTVYTLAQIQGMQFQPALNANGSATFAFTVQDSGGTANGGVDTLTNTVPITVTPVNDPPVITSGAVNPLTVLEDAAITSMGFGTLTFGPGGGTDEASQTLTYKVTVVPSPTLGNVLLADGTTVVTVNTFYTLTQIQGMQFKPALNANGTGGFTFNVQDNGGTANGGSDILIVQDSITVTPVNDPPVITSGAVNPLTILEDAPITTLGFSTLAFGPGGGPDETLQTLTYKVTAVPSPALGNILLADGTTVVTANTIYSLTQLQGMQFKSVPNANGAGTFTFTVQDNGGTANGGVDTLTNNVAITVTAVNDQPVILTGSINPLTVLEDAATTTLGFSTLTFGPGGGGDEASQTLTYTVTAVPSATLGNILLADGTTIVTASTTYSLAQIQGMKFKPALNANGSGTFTFTVQDNGGTANGGVDTLTNNVAINVTPVNDQPVILTGSVNTLTVLEDAALTTLGFSTLTFGPGGGSDEASQTLTYTVTAVPSASLGNILLADGTTIVAANTVYTLAQIQGMQFKPALNANGAGTFTFTVQDSGGTANGGVNTLTNTVAITVTSVNDQPVILTGSVNPLTVLEDSGVTTLGFSTLTFGPGGGADEASQTLTYKVTAVPSASLGSIVLSDNTTVVTANTTYTLAQLQGMKFKTAVNANGSGTFTFTVQDNGGTANGGVDTLTNSVALTVTAVNDQPVILTGSVNPLTVLEDAAVTSLGLSALTFGPGGGSDEASQTLTYTVTAVPSATLGNILLADGTTVVTANTVYTLTQIQGMQFKPALNANGSATFTFTTQDNGGTANGGVDTLTNSEALTVTPVNDQPVILTGTVNPLTVLEDSGVTTLGFGTLTFGPGGGPDEASQTLTYKVTAVPSASLGNIVLADNTTVVTVNTTYTLAQLQGMKFKTAPNANGSGTFSFTVQDNGGTANGGVDTLANSVPLTVTAVNDQPVILTGSVNPLTVLEDAAVTSLGFSNLTFGPGGGSDEASQTLTYTVTAVPSASLGSILLADGTTVVTASTTYTLAQIQGMQFKPVANANGAGVFTFTVQDNGGTANGGVDTLTNNVAVTVTAVNDQPVILTGSVNPLTVLEDSGVTTLGLGGLTFGPGGGPDEASQTLTYKVTAVPSASFGSIVLADGTTVVTANTNYTLAQLQGMNFKTALNGNGSGTFTFTVQDNGGTANGGVDTLTNSVALTVTPVNDQPVILTGSVNPLTVLEDAAATTLGFSTLTFGPGGGPDEASQTLTYKVTTVPSPTLGNIVLADGSTVVTLNSTYTLAQLQGMKFKSTLNANGSGAFAFTVQDNGGTANGGVDTLAENVAITVTAVNDQPVILTGSVNPLTIDENAPLTSLGFSTLTFGPGGGADEASQTLTYKVTTVPSASLGSILLADGTTVVTANTFYTLTQIQGMQFQAVVHANGVDTFAFTVQDSGGTANGGVDTLINTVPITVAAVNDPPTITAPLALTTLEDTSLAILGISFADIDGFSNPENVTLTVYHGTLQLRTDVVNGLTAAQVIGNGTDTISIRAPLAAINATLADATGLVYTPGLNYNSTGLPERLLININDNGYTGKGGAQQAVVTVPFIVTPVNDQPVRLGISLNPLFYLEDAPATSLFFGKPTYGPGGGPDEATQTLTYTVTTVPSASFGNILLADGTTVVTSGTSYTLAQLQGMMFKPALNANGFGTFTFAVQDSGGTANGGVDTLVDGVDLTVIPVNDPPVIATGSVSPLTVLEDSGVTTLGFSTLTFGPGGGPDEASQTLTYKVTAVPSARLGSIVLADNTTLVTANTTYTLTQLQGMKFKTASNANGSGTFTFTVQDNGGTDNGGVDTLTNNVAISVTPVNDQPVILTGSVNPLTVLEDAPLTSLGFSTLTFGPGGGPDEAAQTLTYKVTTVPAGSFGSIVLADGTTVVTANSTYALGQIQGMQFKPALNATGSGLFTFTVQDNGGTANGGVDTLTNNVALNVTPVNDPPVILTGSVSPRTVLEDAAATTLGFSTLTFGPGGGPDEAAQVLTYKVTAVPSASFGNILLGDGTTIVTSNTTYTLAQIQGMQFKPAPNANGSGTFTFTVQDNGGTANGGVDTLTNTVALTVTPVNDQPVLLTGSVNPLIVLEDAAATTLGFSTLTFGPGGGPDESVQTLTYRVTAVPSPGFGNIVLADGTTVVTANTTYTLTQLQGMQFKPALNANGSGSFTFTVQDNGGTANGGVDTLSNTVALTVTPVNDPPAILTGVVNPLTILEDVAQTSLGFNTLTFGPGGGPDEAAQTLTYKVTAVPSAALGNVLLGDGTTVVTANTSYTLAQIQLMQFKPALNANGSGTFTFTVQDNGGTANGGNDTLTNNVPITVIAVNDQPVILTGSVNPLSVLEDAPLTSLGFSSLTFGPGGGPDEASQTLTYKVTAVPSPSLGNIYLADGTTVVAANTTYTLAQIQGMQFKPVINVIGSGTFTFTVQDNGGTAFGGVDTLTNNVAIAVGPVNHQPVVLTGSVNPLSVLEDAAVTSLGFGGLTFGPGGGPDEASQTLTYKVTAVPSASFGNILLADGTTVVTANTTYTLTQIQGMQFKPALNANGSGTFTFTVQDNGGTANGGVDTLTNNVAITVTPVNDPPVILTGSVNPLGVLEDTGIITLGFTNLTFGPGGGPDEASQTLTYKVTAVPSASLGSIVLSDNTTVVTANTTYTLAQLQGMQFKTALNANGAGTFTFTVQDNGGTLSGGVDTLTNNVAITVFAVNDQPVILTGSVNPLTVLEDSAVTSLGLGSITFGPGGGPDEAFQTLTYKVTTIPSSTLGNILLADGTTVVTANTNYTLTQIQGMQFKPAANANGSGTFTFTVQDNGGTANGGVDTLTNSVALTVTPVNDPPVIVTGSANSLTVLEDSGVTTLGFSTLTFGPGGGPDEASQTLTYKVTAVPSPTLGSIVLADNTTVVTANTTYTLAQLQGMKFKTALNANGTGTFTFIVQDNGGTSNGGVDTLSNSVALTVTAVNDAPVILTGSVNPLTVLEDAPLTTLGFSTLTFGPGGGPDESSQTLTYTVTTVPTSTLGNILLADGTTIVTANTVYSLAQIQGMQFKPAANANGAGTFTFTVQDNGGTANGGVDTLTNTVTIAVTPVNDAPVILTGSVNPLTILENSAVTTLGLNGLTFGPGGGPDEASQTLTYAVTAVPDPTLGTIVLADGTTVVTTGAYTLAAIQGMQFNPTLNASGSGTFTFAVQDNGGTVNGGVDTLTNSVAITVTPVNHAPVRLTGNVHPLTVLEDAPATSFGFQTLSYGPGGGANEASQTLTFKAVLVPNASFGTILLADGVTVVTAGSTFTEAQAGQLRGLKFKPALNANGGGTFEFTVQDNGGTANGGVDTLLETVTITVTPVNDPPVILTGSVNPLTVLENAAATSFGFSTLTFGPGGGTDEAPQTLTYSVTAVPDPSLGNVLLSDGTTIVTAGNSYSLAQIQGMQFKPALNAYGTGTFTFTVKDNGGTVNGGQDTLTNSVPIAVTFVAPGVVSINNNLPSPTNQSTISWTVTFNTSVTGVDPTDFALVKSGTVSSNLLQVTGSGSVYQVTASNVTGNGTLGLNLIDDDSIVGAGIPLGTPGLGNGNFTGQVETIDTIFPYVVSINQASTNGSSMSVTATFSEAVTGVTSSSFTVANSGGATASISSVTPVSSSVYTIIVSGLKGLGTFTVNLVDNGQIHDLAGNPLTTPNANAHFASQVTYATGNTPYSSTLADLNADGKLDLIVPNQGSNDLSVLLGNGDGTFQPQTILSTGITAKEVAAGDVNGDGKIDLVLGNYNGNSVSVLLGNGDGTFKPQATFSTGLSPRFPELGDVNGDGITDIVVVNRDNNTVSVLLGNGDGTFKPQATFSTGNGPKSVAIDDVNGDGKPDLVVGNYISNSVSVLLGNGNGTFQPQTTFATGQYPRSVTLGDLNGDGKLDIVIANRSDSNVSVLLGNGNGTFQSQTTFAVGTFPWTLSLGDVNGDGNLDIVVANSGTTSVSVLLGNGNGTFQSQTTFDAGNFPESTSLGDLNGDGRLDIVSVNAGGNSLSVLLGNGNGNFTSGPFAG